jgi:hypothetical protein
LGLFPDLARRRCSIPQLGNLTQQNNAQGVPTIGRFALTNTNNNPLAGFDGYGNINTTNQDTWAKWGYWEANCQMGWPVGTDNSNPGLWCAFWISGAHNWPPEIDLFE